MTFQPLAPQRAQSTNIKARTLERLRIHFLNRSMASKLCALAVELVEHIASPLEPADLFSLRLVCKELNEKTFQCFGHTCFTIIRTDLSRKSLQKLEALSEHEQLRHHARALLIMGPNDIGRGFPWDRHRSGHLLAPLPGVQMLRDILFCKLVNCRSFHIYRDHEAEDFYMSDCLTPSDVVAIILNIIAETSLPVKSFCVDFRKWGTGKVDAKRLHFSQYQNPEFGTAWAHLQELSLEQTMTPDTFNWAMELVLRAINLQKLTLKFEFNHSASFVDRLSSADTLPGLKELKLSCFYVTVEILSRLLLRFRSSLRALSFWHVSIQAGGTWMSVLRMLRSDLPLLESICVNHLKEFEPGEKGRIMFPALSENPVVPGSQGRDFSLVSKRFRGEPRIFGVSYSGPEMDVALEILARSVENI